MNKVFDKKIFFEGIRSLRLIGILLAVFSALSSSAVFTLYTAVDLIDVGYMSSGEKAFINLSTDCSGLILLFFIVTPLMLIHIFRFTRKKAQSDFYFSIPKTRTQIFVSLFMAVMFWVTIIALANAAVVIIGGLIHPSFVVNFLASFKFLLGVLVSCLLVGSAVMIAISTTGNLFGNISISLVVLFLPRTIISIIVSAVESVLGYFDASNLFFLGGSCNIPYDTISLSGAFEYVMTDINDTYSFAQIIYTFLLGVVYFLIAIYLFNRRKSEAAGNFVADEKINGIYRIAIASWIVLGCFNGAFYGIFRKEYGELIISAVMLPVAFVVYCAYEIISTKSWKKVLKAMPKFYIVGIIGVVGLGAMLGLNAVVNSYSPTADDISYISIYDNYTGNSYIDENTKNIKITDPKALQVVSDALAETKSKPNLFRGYYEDEFDPNHDFADFWTVKINSGGINRYRKVYVNEKDEIILTKILEENKEYKELFIKLPEYNKSTTKVDVYTDFKLTDEQKVTLYKTYLEDLKTISFADHYNVFMDNAMYTEFDDTELYVSSPFNFYVNVIENGKEYGLDLSVTGIYKNTYKAYFEMVNKQSESVQDELIKRIDEIGSIKNFDEEESDEIYFTVYGAETEELYIDQTDYKNVAKILQKVKNNPINTDGIILEVGTYEYVEDALFYENSVYKTTHFYLSKEAFANILKYDSYDEYYGDDYEDE